jgi:DNA-binding response OmpR family regulator
MSDDAGTASAEDPPRVLVVEDETELCELYTTWLADEYEVVAVETAAAAIDALSEAVDVALLDRRLPDGSGDEVLEALRERGHEARVAMITAVAPDFDILEMGFDDYLVKPVTREELLEVVETLLARRTYDERLQRFAALTSKQVALAEEKSEAELAASEEYADLETEIGDLRAELDDLFERFDQDDFRAAFLTFDLHPTDHDANTRSDDR